MTDREITLALNDAAAQLGVSHAEVFGYWQAGRPWDAGTAPELTEQLVTCWHEQVAQNEAYVEATRARP